MIDNYKEKLIDHINEDVDSYGENSEEYRKKCIQLKGCIFFKNYLIDESGKKIHYKDCEIKDLKYYCTFLKYGGE
jgi:hypothetical protein